MAMTRRLMMNCMYCLAWLPVGSVFGATASVAETAAGLGFTPESVVVADLQTMAATILGRLESAGELRQALETKRQAVDAASASVSQLAMAVRSNPDDSQLVNQFQAASSLLQTANTQLQSTADELRQLALNGAAENQIQRLQRWRDNSDFRVPAELRAAVHTVQEWQFVELALRAERRAIIRSEALDGDNQAILSSIRNEVDVIAATQRLATQLNAIELLFTQFDHP